MAAFRQPPKTDDNVTVDLKGRPFRLLVLGDIHAPHHDAAAFELACQAGEAFFRGHAPENCGVVSMGDLLDCFQVSSHSKPPSRRRAFKDELEASRPVVRRLEKLPAAHRFITWGNHEDRLDRFIADVAPQLDGMLSLDEFLTLSASGWRIIPYHRHLKIGKLYLTHDLERAGVNAHRQAVSDMGQRNIIIGHVHRLGWEVVGDAEGTRHVGCAAGWLGDYRDIDYRHRTRALREWSHGFITVVFDAQGNAHVTPHALVGNTVSVSGQLISLDWKKAA